MQKRAPDKGAVLRDTELSIEFVAWCFIWRGAALAVASATAGAAQDLRAAGPPEDLGGVAQLGERLLCKQEVIGSIPFTSTTDATHGRALLSTPTAALLSLSKGAPREGRGGKSWCSFLSCTVRLSRLRGQPLAPPGAASAAPYDRVKQCLL